jgi:hypothetical protein
MAKLLLVGLGDLGSRIARGMARTPELRELVLAGRGAGAALASELAAMGGARVSFEPLDAADPGALEALLRRQRPDVVLHAAALLSPWHLPGRTDPVARAVESAGFAAQLPVQLPLLLNTVSAVAAAGLDARVVNCSYPDLTHPVLARMGLAPAAGTGNVAMVRLRVLAAGHTGLVRVLGHHAHVTGSILARPPANPADRPRVYLGEDGERADGLAYAAPPLASDRTLNAVSAASALPVVRAFLPGSPPLRASVSAPLGLAGGYPVTIEDGEVALDLPPGLSLAEAEALQAGWARADGVERIDVDGTVHFTEAARRAVAGVDPGLCEPLEPARAWERARRLLSVLGR